ncbi:MAG TPA: NHL repeat-containing protein [Solirubrobacteraceae bacterium]|jgi:tripartite motif-containing protein 71|nr:NHL repeat-containing protein [Solirubrobacteraceae bacterium]
MSVANNSLDRPLPPAPGVTPEKSSPVGRAATGVRVALAAAVALVLVAVAAVPRLDLHERTGAGQPHTRAGRLHGRAGQPHGRTRQPHPAKTAPCPGAVGAARCPYTGVSAIGRRGEGVLRVPEAIAVGPGGVVYVADQFSHVVQRFSPTGRYLGQWGSYGAGPGQFGAIGALAVDAHDDVYAVDSTNDRVEELTAGGRFLRAWGAPGWRVGQFRFGGGAGPDMPPGGGIAVAGGYVYVSDTNNNRIQRFTLDGTDPVAFTRAGPHHAGFAGPRGVAVAGGRIYVADLGRGRVVELTLDGRFVGQSTSRGVRAHRLNNPYGLAVYGGHVYVADDNNGRVVELDRRLRWVRAYTGAGADRLSKWLRDVAVGDGGRVYVADSAHGRIVELAADGAPLHAWGTLGITHGQMTQPLDVAADRLGDVYVVATYGIDSPIYLYGPASHDLRHPSFPYRGVWKDGGRVVIGTHWFAPTAATVGPDGSLWVTDRANGVVRRLSTEGGTFLGSVGRNTLADPDGVAVSAAGEVYVADTGHNRVVRLSAAGAMLGSFGASGPRAWRLEWPTALAVAGDGDVYVADSGRNRIAVYAPDGRFLGSWGSYGTAPGHFEHPAGVAVDARGHVFVSDRANNRIEEFTSHGHLLALWGAPGAGPGDLSQPDGLAIDCNGDLLVADTQNNRVEVFGGVAAGTGCEAG